jgi:hypothetical protein
MLQNITVIVIAIKAQSLRGNSIFSLPFIGLNPVVTLKNIMKSRFHNEEKK